MARPKRVNPGELRYPARHAPHSDHANERHQSCIAWSYAKFELDYLYDLLIDLKSGHAARERLSITSGAREWPLPTESEVRDCLQKTFELAPTDLGPNKPSPRQKIGAPVKPDTQILRRMGRQTAKTVCHQIGHAFFSDAFIDNLLRHIKT